MSDDSEPGRSVGPAERPEATPETIGDLMRTASGRRAVLRIVGQLRAYNAVVPQRAKIRRALDAHAPGDTGR